MADTERYCYRVEERTIVPGKVLGEGTAPTSGLPVYIRRSEVLLIIESRTEQPMDMHGNRYRHQSDIPPAAYFHHSQDAEKKAKELHVQSGCTAEYCGWKQVVEQEKAKEEKK